MRQNIFKSTLIALLLGVFFTSNLFAQSPLVVNGDEVSYYYHKTTDNSGTTYGYLSGGSYSIGKVIDIGLHDWEKYRSTYEFNISNLPSNATITAVKLSYSVSSTGSAYDDFKVTDYQVTGSSSYSERWAGIGSATAIFNNLGGSSGSNKISSTLTNRVNNSRTNNLFTLGALSNDESTDGSYAITSITVTIEYTTPPTTIYLTAKNDMNGYSGGNIGVGVNTSTTSKPSPHPINDVNVGDNINLQAYENQTYGGYNYIWNDTEAPNEKSEWRKEIGGNSYSISNNQSATYKVASNDNGANLVGYLKKVCNLTFANNLKGTSENGSITVNGQSYNAPTSNFEVVEQNTITATAGGFIIDDVQYIFSNWDNNVADSFSTKTFTASSNFNHVANFIGTPLSYNIHLTFNSYNPRVQEFVTLYWDELASTGITKYYIWRKMNGVNAEIIGSVNRGTTTFTDSDYYRSANGTNINIGYGIQAYFQPDNTYSSVWYSYANGESSAVSKLVLTDSTSNEPPKVEEFSLNTNYPNPFNPSTQISYQLPENSFVNLTVYNALGQEVATLVNQQQSSGKYSVQFNASYTGGGLPSGVYIYKLQAGSFSSTKKMLLTK